MMMMVVVVVVAVTMMVMMIMMMMMMMMIMWNLKKSQAKNVLRLKKKQQLRTKYCQRTYTVIFCV
jgi:hypothetical protein